MSVPAEPDGAPEGAADGGGLSPISGCYLLVVLSEPHQAAHRPLILQRIVKGLSSWDQRNCGVDLGHELQALIDANPEGEQFKFGERLVQFATENVVAEILVNPQVYTFQQCLKNMLSSFTRHRHLIHAGYSFSGNGSWILQDGTFSGNDLLDALRETDVQRVIRAYETSISIHIHCPEEGIWRSDALLKDPVFAASKVYINPPDKESDPAVLAAVNKFRDYLTEFLGEASLDRLLEPSDVVGNIRFSRPTLYVFPGGQGDAAMFGINGFNILFDGGFSRRSCCWNFVRHLDRLDAVLMSRLNNGSLMGMSAMLQRKVDSAAYPQIGHFFTNLTDQKSAPDNDKDADPLLVNTRLEAQRLLWNLKALSLRPTPCMRDNATDPINLYHKVGHGSLDLFVLSPQRDSADIQAFMKSWTDGPDHSRITIKLKGKEFPVANLISICCLLVWIPDDRHDTITRLLFPGSAPQQKVFEGLDRLKHLEFMKKPVCTVKSLGVRRYKTAETVIKSASTRVSSARRSERIERVEVEQKSQRVRSSSRSTSRHTRNGDVDSFRKPETVSEQEPLPEIKAKKQEANKERAEKAPAPKPGKDKRDKSDTQKDTRPMTIQRQKKSKSEKYSEKQQDESVEPDDSGTAKKLEKGEGTPVKVKKEVDNKMLVEEKKVPRSIAKPKSARPSVESKVIKQTESKVIKEPKAPAKPSSKKTEKQSKPQADLKPLEKPTGTRSRAKPAASPKKVRGIKPKSADAVPRPAMTSTPKIQTGSQEHDVSTMRGSGDIEQVTMAGDMLTVTKVTTEVQRFIEETQEADSLEQMSGDFSREIETDSLELRKVDEKVDSLKQSPTTDDSKDIRQSSEDQMRRTDIEEAVLLQGTSSQKSPDRPEDVHLVRTAEMQTGATIHKKDAVKTPDEVAELPEHEALEVADHDDLQLTTSAREDLQPDTKYPSQHVSEDQRNKDKEMMEDTEKDKESVAEDKPLSSPEKAEKDQMNALLKDSSPEEQAAPEESAPSSSHESEHVYDAGGEPSPKNSVTTHPEESYTSPIREIYPIGEPYVERGIEAEPHHEKVEMEKPERVMITSSATTPSPISPTKGDKWASDTPHLPSVDERSLDEPTSQDVVSLVSTDVQSAEDDKEKQYPLRGRELPKTSLSPTEKTKGDAKSPETKTLHSILAEHNITLESFKFSESTTKEDTKTKPAAEVSPKKDASSAGLESKEKPAEESEIVSKLHDEKPPSRKETFTLKQDDTFKHSPEKHTSPDRDSGAAVQDEEIVTSTVPIIEQTSRTYVFEKETEDEEKSRTTLQDQLQSAKTPEEAAKAPEETSEGIKTEVESISKDRPMLEDKPSPKDKDKDQYQDLHEKPDGLEATTTGHPDIDQSKEKFPGKEETPSHAISPEEDSDHKRHLAFLEEQAALVRRDSTPSEVESKKEMQSQQPTDSTPEEILELKEDQRREQAFFEEQAALDQTEVIGREEKIAKEEITHKIQDTTEDRALRMDEDQERHQAILEQRTALVEPEHIPVQEQKEKKQIEDVPEPKYEDKITADAAQKADSGERPKEIETMKRTPEPSFEKSPGLDEDQQRHQTFFEEQAALDRKDAPAAEEETLSEKEGAQKTAETSADKTEGYLSPKLEPVIRQEEIVLAKPITTPVDEKRETEPQVEEPLDKEADYEREQAFFKEQATLDKRSASPSKEMLTIEKPEMPSVSDQVPEKAVDKDIEQQAEQDTPAAETALKRPRISPADEKLTERETVKIEQPTREEPLDEKARQERQQSTPEKPFEASTQIKEKEAEPLPGHKEPADQDMDRKQEQAFLEEQAALVSSEVLATEVCAQSRPAKEQEVEVAATPIEPIHPSEPTKALPAEVTDTDRHLDQKLPPDESKTIREKHTEPHEAVKDVRGSPEPEMAAEQVDVSRPVVEDVCLPTPQPTASPEEPTDIGETTVTEKDDPTVAFLKEQAELVSDKAKEADQPLTDDQKEVYLSRPQEHEPSVTDEPADFRKLEIAAVDSTEGPSKEQKEPATSDIPPQDVKPSAKEPETQAVIESVHGTDISPEITKDAKKDATATWPSKEQEELATDILQPGETRPFTKEAETPAAMEADISPEITKDTKEETPSSPPLETKEEPTVSHIPSEDVKSSAKEPVVQAVIESIHVVDVSPAPPKDMREESTTIAPLKKQEEPSAVKIPSEGVEPSLKEPRTHAEVERVDTSDISPELSTEAFLKEQAALVLGTPPEKPKSTESTPTEDFKEVTISREIYHADAKKEILTTAPLAEQKELATGDVPPEDVKPSVKEPATQAAAESVRAPEISPELPKEAREDTTITHPSKKEKESDASSIKTEDLKLPSKEPETQDVVESAHDSDVSSEMQKDKREEPSKVDERVSDEKPSPQKASAELQESLAETLKADISKEEKIPEKEDIKEKTKDRTSAEKGPSESKQSTIQVTGTQVEDVSVLHETVTSERHKVVTSSSQETTSFDTDVGKDLRTQTFEHPPKDLHLERVEAAEEEAAAEDLVHSKMSEIVQPLPTSEKLLDTEKSPEQEPVTETKDSEDPVSMFLREQAELVTEQHSREESLERKPFTMSSPDDRLPEPELAGAGDAMSQSFYPTGDSEGLPEVSTEEHSPEAELSEKSPTRSTPAAGAITESPKTAKPSDELIPQPEVPLSPHAPEDIRITPETDEEDQGLIIRDGGKPSSVQTISKQIHLDTTLQSERSVQQFLIEQADLVKDLAPTETDHQKPAVNDTSLMTDLQAKQSPSKVDKSPELKTGLLVAEKSEKDSSTSQSQEKELSSDEGTPTKIEKSKMVTATPVSEMPHATEKVVKVSPVTDERPETVEGPLKPGDEGIPSPTELFLKEQAALALGTPLDQAKSPESPAFEDVPKDATEPETLRSPRKPASPKEETTSKIVTTTSSAVLADTSATIMTSHVMASSVTESERSEPPSWMMTESSSSVFSGEVPQAIPSPQPQDRDAPLQSAISTTSIEDTHVAASSTSPGASPGKPSVPLLASKVDLTSPQASDDSKLGELPSPPKTSVSRDTSAEEMLPTGTKMEPTISVSSTSDITVLTTSVVQSVTSVISTEDIKQSTVTPSPSMASESPEETRDTIFSTTTTVVPLVAGTLDESKLPAVPSKLDEPSQVLDAEEKTMAVSKSTSSDVFTHVSKEMTLQTRTEVSEMAKTPEDDIKTHVSPSATKESEPTASGVPAEGAQPSPSPPSRKTSYIIEEYEVISSPRRRQQYEDVEEIVTYSPKTSRSRTYSETSEVSSVIGMSPRRSETVVYVDSSGKETTVHRSDSMPIEQPIDISVASQRIELTGTGSRTVQKSTGSVEEEEIIREQKVASSYAVPPLKSDRKLPVEEDLTASARSVISDLEGEILSAKDSYSSYAQPPSRFDTKPESKASEPHETLDEDDLMSQIISGKDIASGITSVTTTQYTTKELPIEETFVIAKREKVEAKADSDDEDHVKEKMDRRSASQDLGGGDATLPHQVTVHPGFDHSKLTADYAQAELEDLLLQTGTITVAKSASYEALAAEAGKLHSPKSTPEKISPPDTSYETPTKKQKLVDMGLDDLLGQIQSYDPEKTSLTAPVDSDSKTLKDKTPSEGKLTPQDPSKPRDLSEKLQELDHDMDKILKPKPGKLKEQDICIGEDDGTDYAMDAEGPITCKKVADLGPITPKRDISPTSEGPKSPAKSPKESPKPRDLKDHPDQSHSDIDRAADKTDEPSSLPSAQSSGDVKSVDRRESGGDADDTSESWLEDQIEEDVIIKVRPTSKHISAYPKHLATSPTKMSPETEQSPTKLQPDQDDKSTKLDQSKPQPKDTEGLVVVTATAREVDATGAGHEVHLSERDEDAVVSPVKSPAASVTPAKSETGLISPATHGVILGAEENVALSPDSSLKGDIKPTSLTRSEPESASLATTETAKVSPVTSETKSVSPVKSEATPVSPGKSETLPVSPAKSDTEPASLAKSDAAQVSPVKSEAKSVSPAESEAVPVSPVKSDTLPVSPAKSETLPLSPAKSDTEPASLAKSDAAQVSPVKSEAKSVSPAESEAVPVSPVKSDTLPVSPAKSETLPLSPAKSDTEPASLAKSDAAQVSPVKSEAKSVSPAESEAVPVSPVKSDTLPVSPAKSETLPLSPARSDIEPASLAKSDAAQVSPAKSEAKSVSPAKSETARVSPAKIEAVPVSPAKSEALSASPSKKEAVPASPEKSETLPVSPAKSETLPLSPAKSDIEPVSLIKSDAAQVSPVKSEAKPVSPAKSEAVPVSLVKSDTLPVSPAKSETLSLSPARSDIEPVSLIKSDAAQVSPVKSEAKSVSPPKTEAAPVSPVKSDTLPVSPAKSEAAPVSPAKSDTVPVSPAKSDTVPVSPSKSDTLPVSPAKSDTVPVSPAKSDTVPVSPAKSDTVTVSPAKSETVPVSPAKSETLSPSPAKKETVPSPPTKSDTLAVSPAKSEALSVSSAKSEAELTSLAKSDAAQVSPGKSDVVSPAKSEAAPASPAKSDTLPVSPAKSDTVPVSPAKSDTVSVSSAKSETLSPSPAKKETVPSPPTKSDTLPVSPAKSEALSVSSAKSEAELTSLAKSDAARVSPVKSETKSVSPAKSEAAPVSPAKSETPSASSAKKEAVPASPEKSDTLPVSPAKSETLPLSPAKSDTEPASLAKSDAAQVSPVKSEAKSVSPAKSETAPVSPVKSDTLPISPAKSEALSVSSMKGEAEPASPAKSETLEVSPVKSETTSVLPVKSDATPISPSKSELLPVSPAKSAAEPASQARTDTLPVSPAKSEALSVSPAKKETEPTSPAKSDTMPVSPAKSETLSVSSTRSETEPTPSEKSDKAQVSPVKSEAHSISPVKTEAAPISSVKGDTLSVSPTQSEKLPVSPAKEEDEPVSPTKSDTLAVSPAKSEAEPVSPAKSDTGHVSPAKSEALSVSSVRSEAEPTLQAKSDTAQVSPVESEAKSITSVKSEAAPVSPVKSETLPVSPAKKETEPISPTKSDILPVSPAKSEALSVSPAKSETLSVSPEKKEAEPTSPVKSDAVAVSPAKSEALPVSLAKKETELTSPTKSDILPVSQAKSEALLVSPAKSETLSVSPEKKEAERTSPVKGDAVSVSPAKSETLPVSLAKKETELTSPTKSDILPVSPAKSEALSVSPSKSETLSFSPEKKEAEPTSPVKSDAVAVSPAKSETLPVSPVKKETEPISSKKSDTSPVSPAKSETLSVSSTRSETEPIPSEKSDKAQVSPVKSEAQSISPVKTEAAPISSVKSDILSVSPTQSEQFSVLTAKKEAEPASPAKSDTLPVSPAKSEAEPASPAKSDTLAVSPAKSETLSVSPAKKEAELASPAKSDMVQVSPAKSETLSVSPKKSEAELTSPAKSDSVQVSPAKKETLSLSPAKKEGETSSPVKSEQLPVPVAKSETLPVSPTKSEGAPVSPAKSDAAPVHPGKTDALTVSPVKSDPSPAKGDAGPVSPTKSGAVPVPTAKGEAISISPEDDKLVVSPKTADLAPASLEPAEERSLTPLKIDKDETTPPIASETAPAQIAQVMDIAKSQDDQTDARAFSASEVSAQFLKTEDSMNGNGAAHSDSDGPIYQELMGAGGILSALVPGVALRFEDEASSLHEGRISPQPCGHSATAAASQQEPDVQRSAAVEPQPGPVPGMHPDGAPAGAVIGHAARVGGGVRDDVTTMVADVTSTAEPVDRADDDKGDTGRCRLPAASAASSDVVDAADVAQIKVAADTESDAVIKDDVGDASYSPDSVLIQRLESSSSGESIGEPISFTATAREVEVVGGGRQVESDYEDKTEVLLTEESMQVDAAGAVPWTQLDTSEVSMTAAAPHPVGWVVPESGDVEESAEVAAAKADLPSGKSAPQATVEDSSLDSSKTLTKKALSPDMDTPDAQKVYEQAYAAVQDTAADLTKDEPKVITPQIEAVAVSEAGSGGEARIAGDYRDQSAADRSPSQEVVSVSRHTAETVTKEIPDQEVETISKETTSPGETTSLVSSLVSTVTSFFSGDTATTDQEAAKLVEKQPKKEDSTAAIVGGDEGKTAQLSTDQKHETIEHRDTAKDSSTSSGTLKQDDTSISVLSEGVLPSMAGYMQEVSAKIEGYMTGTSQPEGLDEAPLQFTATSKQVTNVGASRDAAPGSPDKVEGPAEPLTRKEVVEEVVTPVQRYVTGGITLQSVSDEAASTTKSHKTDKSPEKEASSLVSDTIASAKDTVGTAVLSVGSILSGAAAVVADKFDSKSTPAESSGAEEQLHAGEKGTSGADHAGDKLQSPVSSASEVPDVSEDTSIPETKTTSLAKDATLLIHGTCQSLQDGAESVVKAVKLAGDDVALKTQDVLEGLKETSPSGVKTVMSTGEQLPEAQETPHSFQETVTELTSSAIADAGSSIRSLGDSLASSMSSLSQTADAKMDAAGDAVEEVTTSTQRKMDGAGHSLADAASEVTSAVQREAASAVESLASAVTTVSSSSQERADKAKDTVADVVSFITSNVQKEADSAREIFSDVVSDISSATVKVAVDSKDSQKVAVSSVSSIAQKETDTSKESLVDAVGHETQQGAEAAKDDITDLVDSVSVTTQKKTDDVKEYVADVVSEISSQVEKEASTTAAVLSKEASSTVSSAQKEADVVKDSLGDAVSDVVSAAQKESDVTKGIFAETASSISSTVQKETDAVKDLVVGVMSQMLSKSEGDTTATEETVATLASSPSSAVQGKTDTAQDYLTMITSSVSSAVQKETDAASDSLSDTISFISSQAQKVFDTAKDSTAEALSALSSAEDKETDTARDKSASAVSAVSSQLQKENDASKDSLADLASSVASADQAKIDVSHGSLTEKPATISSEVEKDVDSVTEVVAAAVDALSSTAQKKTEAAETFGTDLVSSIVSIAEKGAQSTKDILTDVASAISFETKKEVDSAQDSVSDDATSISSAVQKSVDTTRDSLEDTVTSIKSETQKELEAAKGSIAESVSDITSKAGVKSDSAKVSLGQSISSLGSAMKSSADFVTQSASSVPLTLERESDEVLKTTSQSISDTVVDTVQTTTSEVDSVLKSGRETIHAELETAKKTSQDTLDSVEGVVAGAVSKMHSSAKQADGAVSQGVLEAKAMTDSFAKTLDDSAQSSLYTAESQAESAAHSVDQAVSNVTQTLQAEAQEVASSAISSGTEAMREADTFASGAITGVISTAHQAEKDVTSQVDEHLEEVGDSLRKGAEKLDELSEAAETEAKQKLETVATAAEQSASSAGETLASIGRGVAGAAQDAETVVRSTAEAAGTGLLSSISSGISQVQQGVQSAGDQAAAEAQQMTESVYESAETCTGEAGAALEEAGSSVRSTFGGLFGFGRRKSEKKDSPSPTKETTPKQSEQTVAKPEQKKGGFFSKMFGKKSPEETPKADEPDTRQPVVEEVIQRRDIRLQLEEDEGRRRSSSELSDIREEASSSSSLREPSSPRVTSTLDSEVVSAEHEKRLLGSVMDPMTSSLHESFHDVMTGSFHDALQDSGAEAADASRLPGVDFRQPRSPPQSLSPSAPEGDDTSPVPGWGPPLGLPSPVPPPDHGTIPTPPPYKRAIMSRARATDSPRGRKLTGPPPVYLDLVYVPHHANAFYAGVQFFHRVRARYYVFSSIEPSREVFNALLEAKQHWEDKDLEVTIIPTYDTDTLGHWFASNEQLLEELHIDLAPSASRCTINLQDHETSCAAYRLEF